MGLGTGKPRADSSVRFMGVWRFDVLGMSCLGIALDRAWGRTALASSKLVNEDNIVGCLVVLCFWTKYLGRTTSRSSRSLYTSPQLCQGMRLCGLLIQHVDHGYTESRKSDFALDCPRSVRQEHSPQVSCRNEKSSAFEGEWSSAN